MTDLHWALLAIAGVLLLAIWIYSRWQERRALARRIAFGFGDRHQAAQRQPWQLADRPRQCLHVGRRDAALRRLAADVHLQQDVQRSQAGRPLLGQALRDLQPVDRLDPIELLGDDARLVALDRPDEVPLQLGAL